jgi:hypothetical protein
MLPIFQKEFVQALRGFSAVVVGMIMTDRCLRRCELQRFVLVAR